jgi:predicted alpha/beta hydrolase
MLSTIFASLIFSVVGLFVFRLGKREGQLKLMIIGVVLMTYTYFTGNVWADWLVGLGLSALAYFVAQA